jgi:hypothetical protein
MSDAYTQHRGFQGAHRCEFERTLKGEYCTENAEVRLDGLRLCERHAEWLRLEEQAICWRAMLAHIKLWSGEARGRGRGEVVRLLEIERLRAAAALGRILEDLEKDRGQASEDASGDGRALPLLPPLLLLSTAVTG